MLQAIADALNNNTGLALFVFLWTSCGLLMPDLAYMEEHSQFTRLWRILKESAKFTFGIVLYPILVPIWFLQENVGGAAPKEGPTNWDAPL